MKRSRNRSQRQNNPINRSYDSNGPNMRVRGTATQIYEKYQTQARDAMSSGDRVQAENFLQHAEHYYRITQTAHSDEQSDGHNERTGGEKTRGHKNNIQHNVAAQNDTMTSVATRTVQPENQLHQPNNTTTPPKSNAETSRSEAESDTILPINSSATENELVGFAEPDTPKNLSSRRRGLLRQRHENQTISDENDTPSTAK